MAFCTHCGNKNADCMCDARRRSRDKTPKEPAVADQIDPAIMMIIESTANKAAAAAAEKAAEQVIDRAVQGALQPVDTKYGHRLTRIEEEFVSLKEAVTTATSLRSASTAQSPATPVPDRRAASTTPQAKFIPKEVYVQGFYDWSSGTGAIQDEEVDRTVEQLLSNVPKELKDQFVVDKQFPSFRRICFISSTGGESCWQLRGKLIDAISTNGITIGEKPLRVRVQDDPNNQATRSCYWRAVEALKKQATEDKEFILVPKSYGIHESEGIELMGDVTEKGYVWNEGTSRGIRRISMTVFLETAISSWKHRGSAQNRITNIRLYQRIF